MGPIGVQEMIAIFVIALVLFGPKKLPELGRTLGKAISEFRRAKNELKSTFESHLHELERETRLDDINHSPTSYHSARYPYSYDDYNDHSPDSPPPEPQPSTPDTVATEQNQGQIDAALQNVAPADTVPRNNGVQAVSVANQDEYPV